MVMRRLTRRRRRVRMKMRRVRVRMRRMASLTLFQFLPQSGSEALVLSV